MVHIQVTFKKILMMENTIKNKNIGHADDVVNRLTFLNQELGPMLQCLLSMMVFIENAINRTTFYGDI